MQSRHKYMIKDMQKETNYFETEKGVFHPQPTQEMHVPVQKFPSRSSHCQQNCFTDSGVPSNYPMKIT